MKTRRLSIRNPVGGVVKRTAYQDQPDYTAYDASNVWPDNVSDGRQRFGVRPGVKTAVTGTLPGPIRMMHEINVQTETGTESVLVCSAGGNFYRRVASTNTWGSAISTSYTLADDKLIHAAVFGQKLYIADYGIQDSGADLEVSSSSSTAVHLPEVESGTDGALNSAGTTFTSAGSTFITNGVTAGTHVIRFTDEGDSSHATLGPWEIASVDSETQLTLTADAGDGTADTGIDFVVRPSLSNAGVDADNHALEVLESGNGTAGFYTISSIDEDQVTLSTSPGSTSTTGIEYRFHRVPKVWDLSDDTISKWTATTAGTVPLSCNVICYFQDRIGLAGAPSYPNNFFFSAQGDPHDYDYSGDSVGNAVSGTTFTNGKIGDPITALIPHNRQCLVIGAEDSLYVMRGDPASPSSTIDQLSAHLGPISAQAWCKDAEFHTWMLTRDGLYRMNSGCGDTPISFSREKLPEALLNINANDYVAQLKYDLLQKSVHVYLPMRTVGAEITDGVGSGSTLTSATITDWTTYNIQVGDYLRITGVDGSIGPWPQYIQVTGVSGGTLTLAASTYNGDTGISFRVITEQTDTNLAYWVDTVRGGIWPMSYDDGLYPTAICEYAELTSSSLSSVLLGCADGIARQHDRETTTDAGSSFTGTVTIGPFPLTRDRAGRGMIRSARLTPSNSTTQLDWTIVASNSAEAAARELPTTPPVSGDANYYTNTEQTQSRTYATATGYLQRQHPRISGAAAVVKVSGAGSYVWGVEGIELDIAEGGMLR